jgi:shikimate dehydrogenase
VKPGEGSDNAPTVGAETRVFALLGDPVAHSLSPAFQNAAFRARGCDGVYVALRCDQSALPGLIRGLAEAGGGGNVTLPHKEEAAGVVDVATSAVERTGACNTFWQQDGRVWGDNTDVEGLTRALREFLGEDASVGRVLLLGAGGAARAALAVLVDEGAQEVVVVNRTPERALELVDRLGDGIARVEGTLEALGETHFDLVVQATRLGLRTSDPLPFEPGAAVGTDRILDLVYRPGRTRLVQRARELGIPAEDGQAMLLHQGAVAFERWWGGPAPLGVMRAALARAGRGR